MNTYVTWTRIYDLERINKSYQGAITSSSLFPRLWLSFRWFAQGRTTIFGVGKRCVAGWHFDKLLQYWFIIPPPIGWSLPHPNPISSVKHMRPFSFPWLICDLPLGVGSLLGCPADSYFSLTDPVSGSNLLSVPAVLWLQSPSWKECMIQSLGLHLIPALGSIRWFNTSILCRPHHRLKSKWRVSSLHR